MGGTWREENAGPLTIFHAFRPPYDETRPVPAEEMTVETTGRRPVGAEVLDRDPESTWVSPEGVAPGAGLVVRVEPARRLSAIVLAVDLESSPLAVPWVVSVGEEIVAEGPLRAGFQWVGGAPRAGRQALMVFPLSHRDADEVRIVFQGPGPPLRVAEVFAYGPDEDSRPGAGAEPAADAYEAARRGDWERAVELYASAVEAEPHRASHHAGWARARWRAAGRRWLDVESLEDGGPELVQRR
jgi:hypothetical protein